MSSTQEDEDGDDIDDEDNVCIGDVDEDAHRKDKGKKTKTTQL